MKHEIIKLLIDNLEAVSYDGGGTGIDGVPKAAEEISKLFEESKHDLQINIKPFSNELVNALLANALRLLTNEQRRALTEALVARTSLWIPVSERLPEIPEGKHWLTCLVCQEGHVYIADYIGLLGDKPRWEDCGSAGMYGVTHWQNLPELPEGK